MEQSTGTVTLEAFAARVDCHFTTASRLRAGQRLPGRRLLGRIVKEYNLSEEDKKEAYRIFTDETEVEFGEFLRAKIFVSDEDETEGDSNSEETGNDAGSASTAQ